MCKARTDFAGEHEPLVLVIVSDEQGPDSLAGSSRLGKASDDELLPQDAFHLLPAWIALAPSVDGIAALRNDSLETLGARAPVDGLAVPHHMRSVANQAVPLTADQLSRRFFRCSSGRTERSSPSSHNKSKTK